MRGTKAKAIRKAVYRGADLRKRDYVQTNQRMVYLHGEKRLIGGLLRRAWGLWIKTCTQRADQRRWAYQRAKHGLLKVSLA